MYLVWIIIDMVQLSIRSLLCQYPESLGEVCIFLLFILLLSHCKRTKKEAGEGITAYSLYINYIFNYK